jgi:hypothetical protein
MLQGGKTSSQTCLCGDHFCHLYYSAPCNDEITQSFGMVRPSVGFTLGEVDPGFVSPKLGGIVFGSDEWFALAIGSNHVRCSQPLAHRRISHRTLLVA